VIKHTLTEGAIAEVRVDALKAKMEARAAEVEEASTGDYSAKKARAGRDIGKPGKQFAKIAKGAAERYGSKERGEKVAGAVLAKLRKEDVNEADMEEGNDFTGARLAAIRAGKPTFKVGSKTYKVTGDTSDEKVMEREYGQRDDFDKYGRPGDTIRTTKGTLTKTATGVKHERRPEDEEDMDADRDDSAPKKRGRPAGSKRALGAKGPTGKSKLLKKGAIKEGDLEEDMDPEADAGEYGREGDMAKEQLHTIEAAAEELSSILSDEQDLPEWVQKKITLAKEYVDSARDYMLAQDNEEPVAEVAPPGAKAERMVKHIKKGYARDGKLTDREKSIAYATAWKAKKAGKVEEEGKDEVEETTTAGSVAAAPAESPKGKKGSIQFGKGIYEGQLEESYTKKLKSVLSEGMSINMSVGENGEKSLTVSATDDDAEQLAAILKMAGLNTGSGYKEACSTCGQTPCGCESLEEELANSPEESYADTDTMVNKLSGGLNRRKTSGQTTLPVIDLNPVRQGVSESEETRLFDLYKQFKG